MIALPSFGRRRSVLPPTDVKAANPVRKQLLSLSNEVCSVIIGRECAASSSKNLA